MQERNNATDRKEETERTLVIEGRNAVLEAMRAGKPIDKLFVLDGCQDGPVRTIVREAKKRKIVLSFVDRDRLSHLSETGKHQGVVAFAAAYEYSDIDSMLKLAEEKGEDPFLILLDGIEDPHNLGAIIRTANLAGAHGVIIPKRRASGLTATVAKTFGRSSELYTGGKGDESCEYYERAEKERDMVCLRRYGRGSDVSGRI